jgi:hypothetical protein
MLCGRRGWLLAVAWVALGSGWGAVRAADQETREFSVYVDGKPAGGAQMTMQRQDDGTTQMICSSRVKVRVLLITYTYDYQGREIWKNGRLQRLNSSCNDDGKRFQVSAVAAEDGVHVTANGRERLAPAEVWLTSYWCLPDAKLREQPLALLDADTGELLSGRLQHVGTVQMAVLGQVQNVEHYHLGGDKQVDLWYDGAERLVRQEWIEQGHRSVLELARIRR